MGMQSIDIFGFKSGVQKNKKPFLFVDDAFISLQNAYVWREEVKKREGIQLIGRFRRVFTAASIGNSGASPWTINTIYSTYTPAVVPEATAEIDPRSVVIVFGGITFTDQGNGLLTSPTPGNSGYINYLTGVVVLTHTAGAGVAATATFGYYPGLPAMGILTREIQDDDDTVWFDTKYAYTHDGSDFQEFLSPSVTWNGTNSDFFWSANYRGSDSQTRLFFVTNFVRSAGSPMRYTNGTTWTDFQPIIGSTTQTEVLTPSLAGGSAGYGPVSLTKFPIVEGTVVITVSENEATEDDLVFRDTPKDGTLVSSGLNTGTINYTTGAIQLFFNPVLPGSGTWTVTAVYNQGGTYLFTARILIPYYGRLVALNTWEGTTIGSSVNIFNRARFSQIGSPIQQDAWRSDVFGKGGFIDAPVNQDIISATFYKNTLIVFFENSTWRLQYIGEYGTPFIWERISSDFGSESTFSAVLFDSGVLAVGDRAIVGSSGGDVQRIDLDIPDTVYDFKNSEEGPKRVHGVRDFKKEVVYWTYPDYDNFQLPTEQFYPNRTLLYNYRNNTWAFFRNTVTCYGQFKYPANITWDRLDVFWDNENVFWDNGAQAKMPLIASGNQQGFAHFYGYADVETGADSTIDAIDQESLSITNVTVGALVTLQILDHNLSNLEFIYVAGLNYVVTTSPATAGSSSLNNQIYSVAVVDKDNVTLSMWSPTLNQLYNNFTVTNVGTYMGGGVAALFPRINIETKDFNPVKQPLGQNIKTSYIDFLFDASVPSPINVIMKMNTNLNAQGNVLVGNKNVETANSKTGYITNITQTASPICIITSKNHGLLTGDEISPQDIVGSTQLNGGNYTITFLTTDTFSVSQASISAYVSGGYWAQSKQQYFTLSAEYAWHRFFATCFGQYLSLILTYNNEQMSQISTHRQNFVLNAMKIWYRLGGKNIFGK